MFRNVLVPVDGTASAEQALPWALAVAGSGGNLHLIHVHIAPVPVMVEGVVVSDPTLDQSIREEETAYLTRLTERVRAAAPQLQVTARNIDSVEPTAEALAEAVTETSADLVVMTTHGRGPFARFWLGSVSHEFLKRSPVPVLMLRCEGEEAPADLAVRPRLNHLIIPLDGSDLAEHILDPAERLGKVFGADYTLLLVLESLEDPDAVARIQQPDLDDAVNPTTPAQRAEMYLDRIARSIGEHKGVAHTKLVREGAPAEVILAQAGQEPATGIAMATHARSGLSRLLMGSVADAVVRHAHGPVLVFHPPG